MRSTGIERHRCKLRLSYPYRLHKEVDKWLSKRTQIAFPYLESSTSFGIKDHFLHDGVPLGKNQMIFQTEIRRTIDFRGKIQSR